MSMFGRMEDRNIIAMYLLQVLCVLFGISMGYVVSIHHRKKHLEKFEYGFWLAIWSGFIFLTIFPQTVQGIAQTLHIIRVFDLLVIIAFMILVSLSFLNRIAARKLEKKLEEIVRKKAIDALRV